MRIPLLASSSHIRKDKNRKIIKSREIRKRKRDRSADRYSTPVIRELFFHIALRRCREAAPKKKAKKQKSEARSSFCKFTSENHSKSAVNAWTDVPSIENKLVRTSVPTNDMQMECQKCSIQLMRDNNRKFDNVEVISRFRSFSSSRSNNKTSRFRYHPTILQLNKSPSTIRV